MPGAAMNDLLDAAVAAHGGLDRWNQVTSITVDASIYRGASGPVKSQGGRAQGRSPRGGHHAAAA